MKIKVLNLDGVLDSQGEVFDREGLILPTEPVPVKLNFDSTNQLGTARLEKTDDGVYAELDLLPDKDVGGLTPAVGGQVLSKEGHTIRKAEIREIGLCHGHNSDPRIPPIGPPPATKADSDE